jgi:hypothetical protein
VAAFLYVKMIRGTASAASRASSSSGPCSNSPARSPVSRGGRTLHHVREAELGLERSIVLEAIAGGQHPGIKKCREKPLPKPALVVVAGGHADRRRIDPDHDTTKSGAQQVGQRDYFLAQPNPGDPVTRIGGQSVAVEELALLVGHDRSARYGLHSG